MSVFLGQCRIQPILSKLETWWLEQALCKLGILSLVGFRKNSIAQHVNICPVLFGFHVNGDNLEYIKPQPVLTRLHTSHVHQPAHVCYYFLIYIHVGLCQCHELNCYIVKVPWRLGHTVDGLNPPFFSYILDCGADLSQEKEENIIVLHLSVKKGTSNCYYNLVQELPFITLAAAFYQNCHI